MANWKYTVDLKPIYEKYEEVSHEDFDNDIDIFINMRNEIVSEIKKQLKPEDLKSVAEVITKLETSKHLSSFNTAMSSLYDFFDYRKIWLKTSF